MAAPLLASDSALRRALSYRKLQRPRLTVLLLESGYHLQAECRAALMTLGHHVVTLAVSQAGGANTAPAVMQQLLVQLVTHRPDFILCINHIGFDASGTLGELLDAVEMPVAVWYVDSPFFILQRGQIPAPLSTTFFVWERALTAGLQARGATDVHYLPLACDPDKFAHAAALTPPAPQLSFVGDSMEHAQKKWHTRLSKANRQGVATWTNQLLADRKHDLLTHQAAMADNVQFWDMLAAATFAATARYRLRLLQAVPAAALHLFGDAGWRHVLPQAHYRGPVAYGAALAGVYQQSCVNINATSLQMPTAVNQRLFDVPAAGGFLLTDAQADVATHFDLGHEAIVYRDADELADLSQYYLTHASARANIIARAHAAVLARHTYLLRMGSLLTILRARHAPRTQASAVSV